MPPLATQAVIDLYDRYLIPSYGRTPLAITKAKGSRVWDVEGREYLDLFPGWGVSALGYNHPWVASALRGQTRRVMHVANNFYQPAQARAAKALVERSFEGKVFFCNSGAEANEAAIKIARLWGRGRHEIIVMERSFHGRTFGALSATGQDKPQTGLSPMLPGFARVPLNDIEALRAAVTPKTVAVLLEPIQGEGGVHVASEDYLRAVRALCDERKLLLLLDEVQTGMGRTGAWFAFQHAGIEPDVLILAKGLGGGFPVGAIVAKSAIADCMGPGTHGTTYGGNPAACACILAVVEAVEKQGLLERAAELGDYLRKRIDALREQHPVITGVRGRGLMVGIQLAAPGAALVDLCRERGLIVNCTQGDVIRMLPAMTITKKQLRKALALFTEALEAFGASTASKKG